MKFSQHFDFFFGLCEKDISDTTYLIENKSKKRKNKYSSKEEFFITIFWLYNYPSNYMMKFIFNMNSSYLLRIVAKNLDILYSELQNFIKCPKEIEFEQFSEKYENFLYGPFRNHLCVIDGTEITIRRPSKKPKKIFFS